MHRCVSNALPGASHGKQEEGRGTGGRDRAGQAGFPGPDRYGEPVLQIRPLTVLPQVGVDDAQTKRVGMDKSIALWKYK
jgi:hypothetical protein